MSPATDGQGSTGRERGTRRISRGEPDHPHTTPATTLERRAPLPSVPSVFSVVKRSSRGTTQLSFTTEDAEDTEQAPPSPAWIRVDQRRSVFLLFLSTLCLSLVAIFFLFPRTSRRGPKREQNTNLHGSPRISEESDWSGFARCPRGRGQSAAALALCPVFVCHCLGLNGFSYTNRSYYNPKQCRSANRIAYPLRGDFRADLLDWESRLVAGRTLLGVVGSSVPMARPFNSKPCHTRNDPGAETKGRQTLAGPPRQASPDAASGIGFPA